MTYQKLQVDKSSLISLRTVFVKVHLRIASPPVKHPCYMGINIPTEEELIANQLSIAEIALTLNVDSLAYLSVKGLLSAVTNDTAAEIKDGKLGHCCACFTGNYPVPLDW